MKKLKMIISLVLIAALTAGLAITGTLAYLTDRDSEANVFTVGNVSIDLNEDFDQGAELIPGVEIEKKPTITNTGENDAWVWLTFSVPAKLDNLAQGTEQGSNLNAIHWNPLGATTDGYVNDTRVANAIAAGHLPAGTTADGIIANNQTWNVFDSLGEGENVYQEEINGVEYNTYVLLYNKALEPGETTLPNITKVYMDAQIDIDPNGDWYRVVNGVATGPLWNSDTYGDPVIYVSAYAIQKNEFSTVQEAYAAYNKQWTTAEGVNNGVEYPTVVYTAAELRDACKKGGRIILGKDITVTGEDPTGYGQHMFIANGKSWTIDLNRHNITVAEDASQVGSLFSTANGGSITIEGKGDVEIKNGKAFVAWSMNDTDQINVYGGNFFGNGHEGNNALFYVQAGKIDVYGGKFTYPVADNDNWGFNARDALGNKLVIEIHEGALLQHEAFQYGDNSRIKLAEGCTLEKVEIDGETWYQVAAMDSRVEYNGTTYETLAQAVEAAKANGGGEIKMLGTAKISGPMNIAANITIDGNGHKLLREEGFTGTMLTVKTGATLTTENLTLDGAGATATGNLIATEDNGSIVLNAGTVLQNNHGAHAVSLATRGGGTLTLTGAQIINNSSDSGAIWGGGNITINEGSKINNNASTGSAGAIRMVGKCNLTMNGGEICNNKAAGDGGAIWGYGVNGNTSVYDLNGGRISNNTADGTGGAIYTGNYSVINISGDFEMCDNKAANSGAIRLTDHTSMTMTGGKISGNTQNGESNAFNTWNNTITIIGGSISDNFSFVGGLGLTIGAADIDGVISYDLSTNHNTAYLKENFGSFKFTVNEADEHFSNFNFKPAESYTYTEGDEAKLICQNEGYSTYWDAETSTFRLQAN